MEMNKLQLFAIAWSDGDAGTPNVNPVNVTTQQSMSPTMKTFYDTSLLENAREQMVWAQFAQKQPIKGNKVEWRKFNTFDKVLTPLTEGVIPTGKTFGMTKLEATVDQYGDYTAVSDRLRLESYDDVIFGATEEMGASGGESQDILTRNVVAAGTSVAYATGSTRKAQTSSNKITATLVNKAATFLKKNKAPKIEGSYVALIHPSVAEDLRETTEWKEFHKYNDVAPIFKGEIGMLHGVRFIETNTAPIFKGAPLTEGSATLSVKTTLGSTGKTIAVSEAISSDEATALVGADIYINGTAHKIASVSNGDAGSASITTVDNVTVTDGTAGNIIARQGGAVDGGAVYGTIFLGQNAYGIVEPSGETMQMIIKGEAEVGGPLEQFSTIGYKYCHGAKRLYEERILRLETGSSYSAVDDAN